jgi:hypothetical protein
VRSKVNPKPIDARGPQTPGGHPGVLGIGAAPGQAESKHTPDAKHLRIVSHLRREGTRPEVASGYAELSSTSGSGLLDAISRPWPSCSVITRSGSAATRALNSLRAIERRRSTTELGLSEVILFLGRCGPKENPGQERARGPQRSREKFQSGSRLWDCARTKRI